MVRRAWQAGAAIGGVILGVGLFLALGGPVIRSLFPQPIAPGEAGAKPQPRQDPTAAGEVRAHAADLHQPVLLPER